MQLKSLIDRTSNNSLSCMDAGTRGARSGTKHAGTATHREAARKHCEALRSTTKQRGVTLPNGAERASKLAP